MAKYILMPDSFKGTMSSAEICGVMRRAILLHEPEAEIISIPVADGGEGTVDAFLAALGGERMEETVTGPLGEPVRAFYGRLPDGTAVVEMAAAAGLPLAGERRDPLRATTYGVGELIGRAVRAGARRVVLGLGGSATNDGGCGMAAALGAVFRDEAGVPFVPTGGTLRRIASVSLDGVQARLAGVTVEAICDVDSPLFGPAGAAYVFAPQKGADEAAVRLLDDGLRHLAAVLSSLPGGADAAGKPGAGAAGGMGAGVRVFLGGTLRMGIETVLDVTGFARLLPGASLVLTGEGRLDGQSLRGKVVSGVAAEAAKAGVPVIAVAGDIGGGIEEVYSRGVSAVLSINRVAVPYEQARLRARDDLFLTIDTLMRLRALFQREKGGHSDAEM